jgi:hypothetical protein
LELIARRIIKQFPELKSKRYEDVWNHIFQDTLEYRQTNSFNYIVDHTLYRPREIIQFCNDVVETARSQLLPPKLPFIYRHVAEAEHSYSEGRLKDICSEYRFQYPGLQSLFESFRGMTYTFTRDELQEHLLKIICRDLPVVEEAKKWCDRLDPDKLIEIFWTVGFIRAQAVGGLKARRRSGSSYLGSHQISSLNLRNVQRFHVHPMFRSYLGMKEAKG